MIKQIVFSIAEVILAIILYFTIFHIPPIRSKFRITAFFLAVILLSVFSYMLLGENAYFIPIIGGTFGISLLCQDSSRRKVLIYTPLIILALGIMEISLFDIITYIFRFTDIQFFDKISVNITLDVILIMIGVMVIFFSTRSNPSNNTELVLSKGQYILAISGEILSILLCSFMHYVSSNGTNDKLLEFLPVISSMFAFLALLFLFTCLLHQRAVARSVQLVKEKDEYAMLAKLQSEHFSEITKKNDELQMFRHDISHHFQALSGYLQNDHPEKALAYLGEISNAYKPTEATVFTGIHSLDVIIEGYKNVAVSEGITWTSDGRLPQISIKDCFALCTVFSNLIKNALEACQKVNSSPFIDITIGTFENYISITITNSCLPGSSLLETSKSSPEDHGWGLRNVRRTLENNHGDFTISIDGSVCTADVVYQL
ncbi:MAG: GHKL domain-containing protein [Lachnospiraceae bacterium]|nr:GHKL domain-containing protein [Lachnospiraceae bacterium]